MQFKAAPDSRLICRLSFMDLSYLYFFLANIKVMIQQYRIRVYYVIWN